MTKETLTAEAIRNDLHDQIRRNIIGIVFSVVAALFFLLMTVWIVSASVWYKTIARIYFAFPCGLMSLTFFVVAIIGIVQIRNLHSLCQKPGSIVKDRLVGKEVKSHMYRWRYYETCHLYFAGYGEYSISGLHYSWSDLYAMDSRAVYMYAECDDEFYLVLDKPHTGKILLAYNTKMFDYQPTQSK